MQTFFQKSGRKKKWWVCDNTVGTVASSRLRGLCVCVCVCVCVSEVGLPSMVMVRIHELLESFSRRMKISSK